MIGMMPDVEYQRYLEVAKAGGLSRLELGHLQKVLSPGQFRRLDQVAIAVFNGQVRTIRRSSEIL